MKTVKSIIISASLLSAAALAAQTSPSIEIEGNLAVKDNPSTETIAEGNVSIAGSLVISELRPSGSIPMGLFGRND